MKIITQLQRISNSPETKHRLKWMINVFDNVINGNKGIECANRNISFIKHTCINIYTRYIGPKM